MAKRTRQQDAVTLPDKNTLYQPLSLKDVVAKRLDVLRPRDFQELNRQHRQCIAQLFREQTSMTENSEAAKRLQELQCARDAETKAVEHDCQRRIAAILDEQRTRQERVREEYDPQIHEAMIEKSAATATIEADIDRRIRLAMESHEQRRSCLNAEQEKQLLYLLPAADASDYAICQDDSCRLLCKRQKTACGENGLTFLTRDGGQLTCDAKPCSGMLCESHRKRCSFCRAYVCRKCVSWHYKVCRHRAQQCCGFDPCGDCPGSGFRVSLKHCRIVVSPEDSLECSWCERQCCKACSVMCNGRSYDDFWGGPHVFCLHCCYTGEAREPECRSCLRTMSRFRREKQKEQRGWKRLAKTLGVGDRDKVWNSDDDICCRSHEDSENGSEDDVQPEKPHVESKISKESDVD